ncbi:MAG TPA: M28 family peptidase [Bacteriovoracaceae bacterium]|nr:M28 family peptidase [Bacteriovoracaceae bacterium]
MIKASLATLLLGSLLTFSAARKPELYQVISAHPHDVQEFSPYIETIKQDGRLWLVNLKTNTPRKLHRHFKKTTTQDVRTYLVPEALDNLASPAIKEYVQQISSAAIKKDVGALTAFKTRLVGTADNQQAVALVKDTLEGFGYSVKEICYKANACSVIADKAGADAESEIIMLMAHVDSVGKDFAGADDNASGTATLLEVARVLKDYSSKRTIRFFVTNGEESGLLGAAHYAKLLAGSGEIKKMVLAINMDMVGYNANGIVELETDSQYENLAKWFAQLTSSYTKLKSKITIGAWGSDHVPFIKGGVPTLLTIEDWSTKTPCYHQACDKASTLNYEYAGEIAKLNLAAIMSKDSE